MRLPNEFSKEARAISAVMSRQIPLALDGVYLAAHQLAEDGYCFRSDFNACHDGIVDGHLHDALNKLLANNLHHLEGRSVNSLELARQIAQAGVYDPSRLVFPKPNVLAVGR